MGGIGLASDPTLSCYLICGAACATACSADAVSPVADVMGAAASYTSLGGK